MKTPIFVLAVISACICLAQSVQGPTKEAAAKKDRASMLKERQERILRMTGGALPRQCKEPGIAFLNAQTQVPVAKLEATCHELARIFHASVYVRESKPLDMNSIRRVLGHRVVIAICDAPGYPDILTAPDENWAIINMTEITRDKPSTEVLAKRLDKQMQRAFGFTCGGSFTGHKACVMKPARTNAELDSITGYLIGPDIFANVASYIYQLKCAPGGTCTYLDACKEGWAPAPTNDIQKAIWEKVKNGEADEKDPTNRWKRDFKEKK